MGISDHVLIVINLWGKLTLGAPTNPSGSGFWHQTAGVLDGAASHGLAGQLPFGGATDILWGAPSGDLQLSTSVIGSFKVAGLLGAPIPPLAAGNLYSDGTNLYFGEKPQPPVYMNAAISASTLVPGTLYLVDTSEGAITQNLPTSGLTEGMWFNWTDWAGTFNSTGSGTQNFSLYGGGTNLIVDPNFIGNGPAAGSTAGKITTIVCQDYRATYRTTWIATHNGVAGFWHVRRMA